MKTAAGAAGLIDEGADMAEAKEVGMGKRKKERRVFIRRAAVIDGRVAYRSKTRVTRTMTTSGGFA
jgi:hypothetical protein